MTKPSTFFGRRRNIIILRLLLIFAFTSAVTIYAMAYSSGITGRTGPTNGCDCHGSSPNTATTVTITSQSGNFSVEAGATANFTVTVSNSSMSRAGVNIAVKTSESGETNAGTLSPASGSGLQSSGNELTHSTPKNLSGGSASFQFTWTAPTTSGTYYIRVVGNAVNGNGQADNNDRWNFMSVQQVTVTAPTITLNSPNASSAWCQGSQQNVTWTSSGISNIAIELSSDGGSTYPTVIAASVPASTGSYSWRIPESQTPGNQYRIRISDASNSSRNSASQNFSISASTAITTHPTSLAVCTGELVSFSVVATGGALTYQWRKNGNNISNATNAAYTISTAAISDTGRYDCVVTGACGSPVTSNQATLSLDIAPKILVQPTDQETCAGGNIKFEVTAEATDITYQWQKNGTNIPGATTNTLEINDVKTEDAGGYKVVVNGKCNQPANSNSVALIVNAPPEITHQPANVTVCQGGSATFSVQAKGNGLLYQWRKNGAGIPNANSATLLINNASSGDVGKYDVVINGKCQPSATSAEVTLSLISKPVITQNPVSQTVTEGTNIDFTVAATGDNLKYQWQKDNQDLPGKTTADLHLDNVSLSDAGSYKCIVSNDCHAEVSSVAVLNVNPQGPGPVLTLQHTTIDFGMIEVTMENEISYEAFIKNAGTEQLVITGAELTGSNSSEFSFSGLQMPLTLEVNQSASMSFMFKPESAGVKSAQINFVSNAASNPVLNLTGIGGLAQIISDLSFIEFKAIELNKPVEMSFILTNEGNLDGLVSLYFNNEDIDEFSIVSPSDEFVVGAGQQQSVTVAFTPKTESGVSQYIDVYVNGVDAFSIQLEGVVNPSSVEISGVEFDNFRIYPNPSMDKVSVNFSLAEAKNLESYIVNMRGDVVKSFGIKNYINGSNTLEWNFANDRGDKSPAGKYLLIFRAGNKIRSFPIIISK